MTSDKLDKIVSEIIYYLQVIVLLIVGMIGGIIVSIFIAIQYKNYFLLSYVVLIWMKMLKDLFGKNYLYLKDSKFVSKYPHSIKLVLLLGMILTMILSNFWFISFLIFTIISSDYFTLSKALKEGLV